MGSFIKKKKWMILLLVTFIGLSSWYFVSNKGIKEAPEKADLVFLQYMR